MDKNVDTQYNYNYLTEFSKKNVKEFVNFLFALKELVHINGTQIPFAVFKRYDLGVANIESFVKILNSVIKKDAEGQLFIEIANESLKEQAHRIIDADYSDAMWHSYVKNQPDIEYEKKKAKKLLESTIDTIYFKFREGHLVDNLNVIVKIANQIKRQYNLQDEESFKDTDNSKKYSDVNEDIFLETLGITIKGDYILRGKQKIKLNPTDKKLIYHLFYKSLKNRAECFTIDDLSKEKELGASERYIKNRITAINKLVKDIINRELRLKIPKFIQKESRRGYHLNPKILYPEIKKAKKAKIFSF